MDEVALSTYGVQHLCSRINSISLICISLKDFFTGVKEAMVSFLGEGAACTEGSRGIPAVKERKWESGSSG